jgi:sterol 3beta-glucosyltransferase
VICCGSWPARLRPALAGYWWPPTPAGWQPPPELTQFLDDGPAPVYLGFGSILTSRKQAARLSTIVATTMRQLGVRAVVQAGWAGLNVDDTATSRNPDAPGGSAPSGAAVLTESANVLTIGEAPHDWLFPRMAAVVHHCGAGTTAAGLRAGIPAVGVPLVGDQPFWARRLRILGVSAATVPQYRLNPKRLTTAIDTALTDTTLAANARNLANHLATEDGATAALTTITDLLATD